jgi:predicted GH43/DUF377 family glycosyl hydrolase
VQPQSGTGGGTPPVATRHGWLIIYHGVSEMAEPGIGFSTYIVQLLLQDEALTSVR